MSNRWIQNLLLPSAKKYEFGARAGDAPSVTRLLPLLLRWVQDVCLFAEVSCARIHQTCIFLHYFGPGSPVFHAKRAVKVDYRRAFILHLGARCSWGGSCVVHPPLRKIRLLWEVNGYLFDYDLILNVTLVIQLSAVVFIPDIMYRELAQLLHAWVLLLLEMPVIYRLQAFCFFQLGWI